MAQRLREMTALPVDKGLVLNTHIVANNTLQLQFQVIQCPFLTSVGAACMWCRDMHTGKIPMHIK